MPPTHEPASECFYRRARVSWYPLQVLRRSDHRAPHMRNRAVVKAKALFGLAEIAADNVGEFLQLDMHVRVERIDVVHGYLPARHVPFVVPHPLVVFLDIRVRSVFLAK